jgi:catechol 2,3-dioxygenase-like lactoylglutathione lyase family enzyme
VIQHVSLELASGDVDAAVGFWALLGFARVEPPPGLRDRSVWVASGGQQIHFLLTDDPVAPPSGHVALHLEDYDAAVARLREAGFEVDPRAEHWGAPRAFVRGPGGHRVEVMAAPPP